MDQFTNWCSICDVLFTNGYASAFLSSELKYDLRSDRLRPIKPKNKNSRSAGAFDPDKTLINIAGVEPGSVGVADGFSRLWTYAGERCTGNYSQASEEQSATLQHKTWYPSAQTLVDGRVDGSILIVGGADKVGFDLNEASRMFFRNEIIYLEGRTPPPLLRLLILKFTDAENL